MYFFVHPILSTLISFLVTLNILYQFLTLYVSPDTILHSTPISKPSQPKIYLKDDGTFRIAIFSDLHFGEEESGRGAEKDQLTNVVMEKILDVEKPDFVVLNGDLISGDQTYHENSTKYLDNVVQPLVAQNYRWASTYGNHDTQYNLSREALFREEAKYELSYTRHSPDGVGGVTNYWVPIYRKKENGNETERESRGYDDLEEDSGEKPVAILWFFDSLGGENYQRSRIFRFMPNWVVSSAVSYYKKQSAVIAEKYGFEATGENVIPSFAFVHIPTSAFKRFGDNTFGAKKGGRDPRFPGLYWDAPVDEQGQGRWWHRDREFVNALKEGGVLSVFSGHDHGDSWCGVTEDGKGMGKPYLCFCKRTGYGGYGPWNRGGRVLELKFEEERDVKVESWVRMETGRLVQRVGLNETYGIDVYPEDDLGEGQEA